METITLNKELTLTFPDGFHVMDDEERSRLQFFASGAGECLSDPEKHIIVSAAWAFGGLASLLLNASDLAKGAESRISKPMAAYGYVLDGFPERQIGGVRACAYRYHYTVDSIGMNGETWVLKNRRTIYYLHFYYRAALAQESLPVVEEILGSARWG